jgi:hypothetical protein
MEWPARIGGVEARLLILGFQRVTTMVARLVSFQGRLPRRTGRQAAVKLYSRNQNDFKKRFPPSAEALGELGDRHLDGEIVALDNTGHPRFEWLVNRGPQKGTLVYYVFDLLSLDGKDLRRLPLEKRKARLAKLLKNPPRLIFVDHVEGLFGGALALGLEGIVATLPGAMPVASRAVGRRAGLDGARRLPLSCSTIPSDGVERRRLCQRRE